jgi:hypothetical protein
MSLGLGMEKMMARTAATSVVGDEHLPHKFPKVDGHEEIIAWECQACGEWIKEYGSEKKTNCTINWRDMTMGTRQKVMKEPPMGSVVIDRSGSAWQRHPVGWCVSGGDGSWNYTWKELLKELYLGMTDGGPTPEWAPVLGDPRLPCIVYVPHEELLIDEDDI